MTPAKLAFIGNELAELKVGRPNNSAREQNISQEAVAAQLGINGTLISNARTLKRKAEPNIVQMVESGAVGLKNATTYAMHTPRAAQRTATAETVKREGSKLRTPNKTKQANPITHVIDDERMIAVEAVIKTLRPLVKEVRDQSKRHMATVSFGALGIIAGAFERIFTAWASGDDDSVRRIAERFARAEIRRLKGPYAYDYKHVDEACLESDTAANGGARS
jgi:hypothetical protein